MNGEYILSQDPYNFDTLEEFIAHHFPELSEEGKRSYRNDENTIEEDVHKR